MVCLLWQTGSLLPTVRATADEEMRLDAATTPFQGVVTYGSLEKAR
jgi:hypothetical protein